MDRAGRGKERRPGDRRRDSSSGNPPPHLAALANPTVVVIQLHLTVGVRAWYYGVSLALAAGIGTVRIATSLAGLGLGLLLGAGIHVRHDGQTISSFILTTHICSLPSGWTVTGR